MVPHKKSVEQALFTYYFATMLSKMVL